MLLAQDYFWSSRNPSEFEWKEDPIAFKDSYHCHEDFCAGNGNYYSSSSYCGDAQPDGDPPCKGGGGQRSEEAKRRSEYMRRSEARNNKRRRRSEEAKRRKISDEEGEAKKKRNEEEEANKNKRCGYDTDKMRHDTMHWFVIVMVSSRLIGFVRLSS